MSDRLPSARGAWPALPRGRTYPIRATSGPYRPFATDPGWNEAWWWLALPSAGARRADRHIPACTELLCQMDHPRGLRGTGIFPIRHHAGRARARRPAAVQAVRAPAAVRAHRHHHRRSELPLHRRRRDELGPAFLPLEHAGVLGRGGTRRRKPTCTTPMPCSRNIPRAVLELGVLIGGIIIPIAAMFDPRVARQPANRCSCRPSRCCRLAVAWSWASSSPTWLSQKGYLGELLRQAERDDRELALRSSMLAYLIVFARRIREIEARQPEAREGRKRMAKARGPAPKSQKNSTHHLPIRKMQQDTIRPFAGDSRLGRSVVVAGLHSRSRSSSFTASSTPTSTTRGSSQGIWRARVQPIPHHDVAARVTLQLGMLIGEAF